jgi:chemotaxis protein histidine kinase CheA
VANEVIPEALRRRYIDSFPDKWAALDAAASGLSGHDPEALLLLRMQAHKLAGSAGMYGFDDLGHLAREVVHAIDAGAGVPILSGMVKNLVAGLISAHATLET